MKSAPGPVETISATTETSRAWVYRWAGVACMIAALIHTAAIMLGVYTVREGNLGDFVPMKILEFVAGNVVLWKSTCLMACVATIAFVVLLIVLREVVERRLRVALNVATVLTAIAAPPALNGQMTMAVLFCDFALQNHYHHAAVAHEVSELAWAVMNSGITQCILIGNTLNSVAGIIIVACMLNSKNFPKWLAWLGMPIWIASLNVSALAFMGSLQWALVLAIASSIAFVMWATAMGLIFRMMGRPEPRPSDKPMG